MQLCTDTLALLIGWSVADCRLIIGSSTRVRHARRYGVMFLRTACAAAAFTVYILVLNLVGMPIYFQDSNVLLIVQLNSTSQNTIKYLIVLFQFVDKITKTNIDQ